MIPCYFIFLFISCIFSSLIAGISGAVGRRLGVDTPMARSLPARMCSPASCGSITIMLTFEGILMLHDLVPSVVEPVAGTVSLTRRFRISDWSCRPSRRSDRPSPVLAAASESEESLSALLLQALAQNGNGAAAYIDTVAEAPSAPVLSPPLT